jgi:PilZ domain-containing protein
MTDKEKRRAPRRRHNSVVEIFDESGNAIAEIARLVDFSEVGACFRSQKVFPVKKKLRLRLRLLREGRLYIWARIVWSKKKANTILYGIEFEKVHDVA